VTREGRRVALVSRRAAAAIAAGLSQRGFVVDILVEHRAFDAYIERDDRNDAVFLFLPSGDVQAFERLSRVADRAVLQLSLRELDAANLEAAERAMHDARGLIFATEGEREFARRRFGPGLTHKSSIVGAWLDPADADDVSFPLPSAARDRRYLLYVGPREASDELSLLIESFRDFRRNQPLSSLELILAGLGRTATSRARDGIIDVGTPETLELNALLRGALAVAQPDLDEGVPWVLLRAWAAAKPVCVDARCLTKAHAVSASGGGWAAATRAEWAELFASIDHAPGEELDDRGRRGQAYCAAHATRDAVLDKYAKPLESVTDRERFRPADAGARWDVAPNPDVMRTLSDGKINILCVGPFDENADLEAVLAIFAFFLSLGEDARLVLAGAISQDTSFAERVLDKIANAGLAERVLWLEAVPLAVAAACYRTAALLLEFGSRLTNRQPLADAMAFEIPVIVRASPEAREFMGRAGMLVDGGADPLAIAVLARMLVRERALRDAVLREQRARFA